MSKLILTGFMGSGKSTLGKMLSSRLKFPFYDTDALIEKKQGRKIEKIFEDNGEDCFRSMEEECIRELLSGPEECVVSTGGGAVLKEENRKILKKSGTVFYLKAGPELLYGRLEKESGRPLLKGDGLFEKICEMLTEREGMYRETAHYVVDETGKNTEQLLDEIIKLYGGSKTDEHTDH